MGVTREIDPRQLTPEQVSQLEQHKQANTLSKQLLVMQQVKDALQGILVVIDEKDGVKDLGDKLGPLLIDVRESLKALEKKKDPEQIDFSKPITDALKRVETALGKLDLSPEIKVSAPDVNVPETKIDLKPIEKVLKTEMPKAFDKAIQGIPKPEKADYQPLLDAWEGISEQLQSIDTASRMKPQFPINQLNAIKTATETAATASTANYATKIDDTTTADVVYIGNATIGSVGSDAVWQIKKLNTASIALDKTWADGNDSFDNVWDNRAGLSYS